MKMFALRHWTLLQNSSDLRKTATIDAISTNFNVYVMQCNMMYKSVMA